MQNFEKMEANIQLTNIYQKSYSEAICILQKRLQRFPNDPQLHFLYGNILAANESYSQAQARYQNCLYLNSKHQKCLYNYANMLCELQKYQQAQKCYKKALHLLPNDVQIINNFGLLYLELLEYDKAEQLFNKCIEINQKFYLALNNLGLLFYRKQQYSKSQNYLIQCQKLSTQFKYPDCEFNLGLVSKRMGRHRSAYEHFAAYLLYITADKQYFQANFVKQIPYKNRRLYKTIYVYKNMLFDEHNYWEDERDETILTNSSRQNIIGAFQYLISMNQYASIEIFQQYASFLQDLKIMDRAGQVYREAFAMEPAQSFFYHQYAQFLTQIGDKNRALLVYIVGMRYEPPAYFFFSMATLAQQLKINQLAESSYLSSLMLSFHIFEQICYASYYIHFLYKLQRYQIVVHIAETYISSGIEGTLHYKDYIMSLINIGYYSEAKSKLRAQRRNSPDCICLQILQGYLSFRMCKFQQAQALYNQALENDQDNWQVFYRLGELYFKQLSYQQAEKSLLRSIQLSKNCQSHLLYARMLDHLQKNTDAQQQYKQCLNLQPTKNAYKYYGKFLFKMNRNEQGKLMYLQAIRIAYGFQNSDLLRSQLAYNEDNKVQLKHYLQKCLHSNPNNVQANFKLGILFFKESEWLSSQKHLKKVVEIDQFYIQAYEPYLTVLIELNKYDIAESVIYKLTDIDSSLCQKLKFKKIKILLMQKKYIEVERLLIQQKSLLDRQMISLQDKYTYYYCYGILMKETQRYFEAIGYFQELLINNPRNSEIILIYAQTLALCGQYVEAQYKFKLCLEIDYCFNNILQYLHFLELQGNRNDDILKQCNQFLENSQNFDNENIKNKDQLYYIFAQVLKKNNQYLQSQKYFRKCLQNNPENLLYNQKLGNLLVRTSRSSEAEQYFNNCTINKKNQQQKITNTCKVCLVDEISYINIVCGHYCICQDCVSKIGNKCPICRVHGSFKKVYKG